MQNLPTTILSSLESLFLQFNLRRLLFWVFIAVIALFIFSGIEGLTGITYFMRVQGKLSVLSTLNTLSKDGIESNPKLEPIYNQLVNDISEYDINRNSLAKLFPNLSTITIQIPVEIWKFISSGIWGFLVAISGLFVRKTNPGGWRSMFIGGLAMGIVLGIIGILIPNIFYAWINIILCPSVQLILILLLPRITTKKS
jgi:hypothetical protein